MQLVSDASIPQAPLDLWATFDLELMLFALFCTGFLVCRSARTHGLFVRLLGSKCPKSVPLESVPRGEGSSSPTLAAKRLEADWASGHSEAVLSAWPALERFTPGALVAVVEALAAAERASEAPMVVSTALSLGNDPALRTLETQDAVCAALPQEIASEVRGLFPSTPPTRASARRAPTSPKMDKPDEGSELHQDALRIRALVRGKRLDDAVQQLLNLHDGGHALPPAFLVAVLRLAGEQDAMRKVLGRLPTSLVLPAEALATVLEFAAKAGDAELLKTVHRRVVAEHVPLTPAGHEALLKGYASLGDSKAVEVFDELVAGGFEPSHNTLAAVVSLCAESRHVQLAEHLASYMRARCGKVSLAVYSALVKVYGHSRMFSRACDLYESMQADKVELDTVAYGCLIKAAVECGRLELARRLFRESGNPDILNYMSLIRAAGRENNVPKALAILAELESSPLEVDTTAYNCALEVCVACGHQAEAEQLLGRMEAANQVDVISYNTFLKLLLVRKAHREVAAVLKRMKSRGLTPNVVTYNSIVNGAVTRGELNVAWELVEEMESVGVPPDAFTCSILMKGVKHSSNSDDVERITSVIERNKVVPDEVLVNSLLDACMWLRDTQRLARVLEQFKASGVVPSMHACATLIRAYAHARRLPQAWKLWRELTEERRSKPSEEVFTAMIDACVTCSDMDGAIQIYHEMRKNCPDYSKRTTVFSTLVKACLQKKQTKRALEIYEQMKEDSTVCNKVTYNAIIDALCRQGDIDGAMRLFRDMSLRDVAPDVVTYSTIIKGHCARGDLEQALQLFAHMRKRGVTPDAILFNSILDGCAHKKMRSLTEQVLLDMDEAGIPASNFTLSILVKLYGRCGDLDKAFEVVETYPKRYSFDVNAQVFTCLMSACISNGQIDRALEVRGRMADMGCAPDAKTYGTLLAGCIKYDDIDHAVQVVKDALDLHKQRNGQRVLLDREAVEGVLLMANRLGRSSNVAVPLLEEVRSAGIEVSDRVRDSIHSAQPIQELAPASRFHQRRGMVR